MHPYLTICTDILVRDKFLAIMSMFNVTFMSIFFSRSKFQYSSIVVFQRDSVVTPYYWFIFQLDSFEAVVPSSIYSIALYWCSVFIL